MHVERGIYMGIMMVTSLNSYAKNMEMKMRWHQRQEENDYAPDNSGSVDETFQKQVDEMRYPKDDRSYTMEADIEAKLTAGKKLNGQELQYLKAHDPAAFQTAKIIERERASYEKELESCTTKEQVEQLKNDHIAAAVKRLNAIRDNKSLSAEKKRDLIRMEHYRAASLDDAMYEFTKSPFYKNLPEEAKGQGDTEEDKKAGLGQSLQSVEASRAGLDKMAEDAAQYDPALSETDMEKKAPLPAQSPEDAQEERTILKAVLDEEARWAREEEENSTKPQKEDGAHALNLQLTKQARNAYLAAQSDSDSVPADTSRIDIRR